jgi:hypothetical protein
VGRQPLARKSVIDGGCLDWTTAVCQIRGTGAADGASRRAARVSGSSEECVHLCIEEMDRAHRQNPIASAERRRRPGAFEDFRRLSLHVAEGPRRCEKYPRDTRPDVCGASRARRGSPSKNPANAKYTRDAGKSPRFERERGRRWAPTRAPSEEHRGCFGKKDHTGTRTSSGKKYVAVHHRSPTPAQTSGCRASTLEERDGLRPFRLPRRVSANPRTPRGGGS